MPRQYQDIEKIKVTVDLLGAQTRRQRRDFSHILFAEGKPDFADPGRLRPFDSHETWGGYDMDGWFRLNITVPEEMNGRDVWLEVQTGREGCWNAVNPQFLLLVNGVETQGMDVNHTTAVISRKAKAGDLLRVDLDAWSGAVSVRQPSLAAGENNEPCRFVPALFTMDETLLKLYYDLLVPYETAKLLDGGENALAIVNALRRAADLLDLREVGSDRFYESVSACASFMEREFYGKLCDPDNAAATAWCIGHTHIDVAWQWRYRHTKRKAERSFSTALSLIERYPEYIFTSSQPQLYEFVKRRPELYRRISETVRRGRWDPEGGMWVEADCNLPSGEALIRQFVHGKRFFKDEFGVDSRVLWLPDVFGYSAALPQICKKCGIDYFMTTKINWNDTNKLPADTFVWRGVDGTGILTHFIPAREYVGNSHVPGQNTTITRYNGRLSPSLLMGGWERFQQKDISKDFLISFGYGDGGGGSTWEMAEYQIRLGKGIPGCPVAKTGKILDFFRHIDAELTGNPRLPEWRGELYLEFHRGTYTSVAKNKRYNRKSEQALQSLEALSVMQSASDRDFIYPAKALDGHWKTLLLNQFHDVLPGSSIRGVYDDTDALYKNLLEDADRRASERRLMLAQAARRQNGALVVFNTLGFMRSGVCVTDIPENMCGGMSLYDGEGNELVTQKTYDGKLVFKVSGVPGMGWRSLTPGPAKKTEKPLAMEDGVIDNGVLRLTLDKKGRIASLFDKGLSRELVPLGEIMNRLETYEDRPPAFDAWDIAPYYSEKRYDIEDLERMRVLESGPVRIVVALDYRYLASSIHQKIIIYRNERRVDFETEIDWHNEHILLKAAFPAEILADKASYEIQYGAIERPTHFNTSWEMAKFETYAQKWADLSEDGYGISVLNDCKYGYDIHDRTLRLTLLRSPMRPCVDADKGRHNFTYALLPHPDGWREGGTVRQAYDLNVPLSAVYASGENSGGACEQGFCSSETDHVNIEVLKAADDGKGIVIRAYEAHGRRGMAKIRISLPTAEAFECDMLENTGARVDFKDGALTFQILPYEIKTFRLI